MVNPVKSRPAAWMLCLATQLLCAPPGASAQEPEVTSEVTVGVRPDRVRVGESFVVTIRAIHARTPTQVDVEPAAGATVLDYEDRWSSGVFERDFRVEAEAQGPLRLMALVVFGADTVRRPVPEVSVYPAGLAWPTDPRVRGNASAEGREPRAEGRPPSAVGRDADRERAPQGLYPPAYRSPGTPPGGVPYRYPDPYGYPDATQPAVTTPSPYGTAYGNPYASPYGPSGWGVAPYGSGWAPGAAGDPWWPELVPRLERYQAAVDDPNGLVRLESGVTPERVFVGQQVTFLATATFPPEALARLGGAPEFFPPTASDAWTVDLPYAPPTEAAARGRAQEAHTFMRAFFPLSAGTFVVDPARLLYSVGSGAPGRPLLDTLVTEPLPLEVLPVPERDAPPGWNGAVGRFRVEAWLQPEAVPLGEAALLTIAVSGAGHVRSLVRPDPGSVWGAELRPTGERALPEVRDGVVGGVKTFSWLVVPVEPGPLRIGPLIYSYFDPWTASFAQVATEELILHAGDIPPGQAPVGGWGSPAAAEASPSAPARRSPTPVQRAPGALLDSAVQRTGSSGPRLGSAVERPPSPSPGSAALPLQGVSVDPLAALGAEVEADPRDGDAWLALARAADQARPGEGWGTWAVLSGRRLAPRHSGLRSARPPHLGGGGEIRAVPAVPLGPRESLLAGGAVGLLALLVAGWGLRGMLHRGTRSAAPGPSTLRLATGLALAGAAGIALEPQAVLHADLGVVVGGITSLRPRPTLSADATARLSGGTLLAVRDGFGGWVRVATAAGGEGWVEEARVARLDSTPGVVRSPIQ